MLGVWCSLVALRGTAETVTLAWDANTDDKTSGYIVYTANEDNQVLRRDNVGIATTAIVTDLAAASTFMFYVTAYDSLARESLPSNKVTHQTAGAVNRPPVANTVNATTLEDVPVNILLQGNDPDGGTVSYSIVTGPTKGTLSGTAPNLIYTPAKNSNGQDAFTYRVSDGFLNSANALATVAVTPVNDAPTVANLNFTSQQGQSVQVTLAGTDPEGSSLSYSIASSPAHGTLSGSGVIRTFTPTPGYSGTDSFTYRASDGLLSSALATVSIQITSPSIPTSNTAPVANGSTAQTMEAQAVSIPLSGSDADGDSLSFTIVRQPLRGTLSGNSPQLTYTPATGFIGDDDLQFVASDGKATSPVATVRISVTSAGGRIKFRRFSYASQ